MTEKHSPLPWIAYGQHVQEGASGHKMNVAWCGSVYGAGMVGGHAESFSITEEQAEANAALIVRAVNGLPEAIAALAGIVADMERKGMGDWPTAKKARAALAKAKGARS